MKEAPGVSPGASLFLFRLIFWNRPRILIKEKRPGGEAEARGGEIVREGHHPYTGSLIGTQGVRMLSHALSYAARGWRVFPSHTTITGSCSCGRDCGKDAGKHPRIRAWEKHASTDPAQITRWWKKWPDANIAIATGAGLVVIDVDGPENLSLLAALKAEHGPFPETLAASTGRGFHLYMRSDLSASRTVDGLLVRSTGGNVIAPPSHHASGRKYQWVNDLSPASLPVWFEEWLQTYGNTKITDVSNSLLSLGEVPQYLKKQQVAPQSLPVLAKCLAQAIVEPWTALQEARVQSALQAIPASCPRDPWLHVGMALHSLHWERPDGTDAGFELWDAWSATCPDKYSLHDVEVRWRSFAKGRTGITIGTLFHMAREAGWEGGVPVMPRIAENERAAPGVSTGAHTDGRREAPSAVAAGAPVLGAPFAAVNAPANGAGHKPRITVFPDVTDDGEPRATCTNAGVAMIGLGLDCRKDVFHEKMLVNGHAIEEWAGDLSDDAILMVRRAIKQTYGFDPGERNTRDAAVQLCLQHQFNPVVDYLDSLVWDGVPRLRKWLSVYLGAADSPLNEAIGTLVLIAAVRRARDPGTKFDQIIVFEGTEGRGKSTAIEILAGQENFSDQSILTLDDRGQQEAMAGVWLYEIADLAGMHRADVERIKAFASRRSDRARPAYGRMRIDRPRQCVLFATTNETTYLKSQTGDRRFWPIVTAGIDLEALRRDRDQLWAEAARYEGRGVSLVLPAVLWGHAKEEQAKRTEHDPWIDLLEHVQGKKFLKADGRGEEWRVSTKELLEMTLQLAPEKWHTAAFKRLSYTMQRLGWLGPRVYWSGEKAVRGYAKDA